MKRIARVPILTWHAMIVSGSDYARNDHIAFARDLETIHALGLRIVPLRTIADALIERRLDRLQNCVGLSIDDGPDFDFYDMPHPKWGPQRGIARILADFRARHGFDAQPTLHSTSFTIVSPEARAFLDRTCMIGCRWWNDDWWRSAEETGLMAVESHSWDHNHTSLENTATTAPVGTFDITSDAEAEIEIGRAAEWLRERRGRDGPVLFAYPYGDASRFVAETWLPRAGVAYGIHSAFGSSHGAPVVLESSRWLIPRYVFGQHWKAEDDLERLLQDAGALRRQGGWVAGLFGKKPLVASDAQPPAAPTSSWSDCLRTWEVDDARVVAGDLFKHSFGHDIPDYPRHFVLVYSPPSGANDTTPRVVAYMHFSPFEDVYLAGGMCVDAGAYRKMPRWLFDEVRAQGGLATIIGRGSIAMLGDSPACFGHVGEPRARAADLRTGFVDTGKEHLMVVWRRKLPDDEKQRLIDRVAAIGAF